MRIFRSAVRRALLPAWPWRWLGLALLLLAGVAPAILPRLARRPSDPPLFGLGRAPAREEIAAWDIDVGPEGAGLPPGQGTVDEGARLYARRCARCHGASGTEGPFDPLVGREPLVAERPMKTIGNYWPYATTLYDYINRAMPFDRPGSLTPNEIYGVIAWLLYRNQIIQKDDVINAETLPRIRMPAVGIFVPDPRRPDSIR